MSSPSEGGNAAEATSADSSETQLQSAAAAASETGTADSGIGATEDSRKAPIRIGTQRYGVKAPPAVPKPVLASPPVPRDPSADAAAPAAEEVVPGTSDAAAEEAAGEAAAPSSETVTAASDAPAAPSRRPDGGKPQRKQGGKKPSIPLLEPQSHRRVELPNLRAGLSEDLELEYMAALGDQSLEEIIASETKSVVAELEPDSRHKGKVIAVHRDNIFVDIGGRQQGVVGLKNFVDPPELGAVLEVAVSRFNPAEGLYELTLPGGAVAVGDWSEVSEGMVVDARVTGHNKGGLECEVSKLRGFIPASQVSMYRVEDMSQFVDQKFTCVVTEVNPEKRNLVLSRRAVLEREKAEAKEGLLASLEVGKSLEGTVRSLQSFGAFVDLGGVDGLVHISQLSWDRLKHADEVLEIGQKIKVKILKIDPQTGKIGLGFRDLSENPWEHVARDFPTRATAKGRVSRVTEFGAFVRLAPGVEGLVHISELSHKRVFRVTDVLTEGQEVEVLVMAVDPEQQRISLSLKALEAKAAPAAKDISEETAEPAVAVAPKKRKVPLQGGKGGPATGEKFGLKW
jgi:small subunit ribosomal protein S1